MSWYHHLTILPLGKRDFYQRHFFCLAHSKEDLCLSGTNTCIWNSTDASLLTDSYDMKTTRVELCQLGSTSTQKEKHTQKVSEDIILS